MICIVKDGIVVYGPAPWNLSSVMGVLVVAGFDVLDGTLLGPDGAPIVQAPVDNLDGPLPLADGFAVLPAVEVDAPAPEGKVLAGRKPVVLEDRVEMLPVWADAPPPVEPASPRTMTKYYFRTRVLTFEERMTMDNSVIPELVTMRNDLFAAEVVDLDEVAKYKPVMLATGLATEARIDEIIAGVTHE